VRTNGFYLRGRRETSQEHMAKRRREHPSGEELLQASKHLDAR